MGGTPVNTSAGKVRKLPPPAMALSAPAPKAAAASRGAWVQKSRGMATEVSAGSTPRIVTAVSPDPRLTEPTATAADTPCPLYVDLDGTLTPTDTLYESALLLVRRHPLNLLRLLAWLPLGQGGLQAPAGRRGAARPGHPALPRTLRAPPHDRARAGPHAGAGQRGGRAHRARGVGPPGPVRRRAGHRSRRPQPSARAHKRDAIAAHARAQGHERWAYAGNSRDDLSVWSGAAEAVAVNAPPSVVASLQREHPQAQVFEQTPPSLQTVLARDPPQAMVPRTHCCSCHCWLRIRWTLPPGARCCWPSWRSVLCASATYLVNDLLDLPADRVHRLKRHRPLAAGSISIPHAVVLGLLMITLAFVLAWHVSPGFAAMLLLYTATTPGLFAAAQAPAADRRAGAGRAVHAAHRRRRGGRAGRAVQLAAGHFHGPVPEPGPGQALRSNWKNWPQKTSRPPRAGATSRATWCRCAPWAWPRAFWP